MTVEELDGVVSWNILFENFKADYNANLEIHSGNDFSDKVGRGLVRFCAPLALVHSLVLPGLYEDAYGNNDRG